MTPRADLTPGGPDRPDPATGPNAIEELMALGERCLANGYPPVPVLGPDAPATVEKNGEPVRQTPGKQPHGGLWSRKERAVYGATPETVAGWRRLRGIADHTNLGLACGRAAAADIDVHEAELADAIEALAV